MGAFGCRLWDPFASIRPERAWLKWPALYDERFMPQRLSFLALNRVLASLDAIRNGRALYALLFTFCVAGLLLAMAESALVRADAVAGMSWGGLALAVTFFGVNATGLLLMDQAQGRAIREVGEAFGAALRCAYRSILSLLLLALPAAALMLTLLGLLWAVQWPVIGVPLFGLLVPVGVVLVGLLAFSTVVLVGPLTGPAVWSGEGVLATVRMLARLWRRDLPEATMLMAAVLLLTGGVSAAVSFVVLSGARVMALLSVWVAGVDVPAQQLMAGLFGYGLRSLGASGAPAAGSPMGMAALVGGGVVFAIALVLPSLVYLRGCCAVYLALSEAPATDPAL